VASATVAAVSTLVADAYLPIVPTGFPPEHVTTRRDTTSSTTLDRAKPLWHKGFRRSRVRSCCNDAQGVTGSSPARPTAVTRTLAVLAHPPEDPRCRDVRGIRGKPCADPVHAGQRGPGSWLTVSGRGPGTWATVAPVPG
jgi:hypothetical protein